ncbi:MAG: alkaline phosphatase family protein [Cellulosilyticaceae bacterium]
MKKKLIMISLDAMIAKDLEYMRELPYLGEFVRNGSIVKTSETVYPSLTYTAHASMISGTYPDKHKIINNEIFNPYVKYGDWYEKREGIKAEILPELCETHGYKTLINSWPTMVGADVTYNLQRAGIHQVKEGKKEAMIENSTDGLMERMWEICSEAWKMDKYYDSDKFSGLASRAMILEDTPDVIFMHMTLIDHYRHVYGVHSEKIKEALDYIDEMLGYMVDALKEKGLYEHTNFVICSDHGQVDIKESVNINRLLIDKGYITVDGALNVIDWKAYCHSAAASAQVYIKDHDPECLQAIKQLLEEYKQELHIDRIFTTEEVNRDYHLNGEFDLVLEAEEGYGFNFMLGSPLCKSVMNEDYRTSVGTHGHLPTRGDQPCQVVYGPDFKRGMVVDYARNIDIAPTCAKLLGFEMKQCDGKILQELLV